MNKFSILLIENQIDVAAKILSVLGQHLASFTLSIARNLAEASAESIQPQVVLLDASFLTDNPLDQLSILAETYPDVPIMLLVEPAQTDEERVLKALSLCVSDYSNLSKAGLLALGRRLANLNDIWSNRLALTPPTSPTTNLLSEIIINDTSQLAIQLISPDNRVQAWNQATEELFGIKQDRVIGRVIDNLPLSTGNLGRLKDILDQARTTGQPFSIPFYHLENQKQGTLQQVHVHVYPIYKNLSAPAESFKDVCIIFTKLPKIDQKIDTASLPHNQELQILLEANRQISGQLELIPTLKKVIEQTKSLLYGDNCQVYFLEKDNKTLRPILAAGPLSAPIQALALTIGQGVIGQAAVTGKAVVINAGDTEIEIPYPKDEQLLCAPLTSIGGTIGLIVVSRNTPPFSKDDLNFFETLIQQASLAINNARLFEGTARSLNELAIVYEASTVISTHWDDQGVLNTLIQKVVQSIAVNSGFIASWKRDRKRGIVEAQYFAKNGGFDNNAERITNLEPIINLSARDAMLTMLNQQRPTFFHQSNSSLDELERKEMEKYGCLSKLLLPLVTKAETIGWIELWATEQERAFTPDEVRMSRTLANQIAVALQNAHYMKQTQRTLDETTALYRVASDLTTLQDQQAIISLVLQEYLQALNLKQGSVIILDFAQKCGIVKAQFQDDNPVRPASSNEDSSNIAYKVLEGRQIPLQNNPVYEQLMRTRQPVIINDPHATWVTTPRVPTANAHLPPGGGWGDAEAFAILVVPIRIREEIIGVLVAENTHHNQVFDRWAVSLGQAMADQLGVGLQNVELFESEYLRREQAETLREVSSVVGSSLNLNEVLERILDELARVIKYDSAAIHLIQGKQRRVIAGRGFDNPKQHIGLTFPIMPSDDEPGSLAIHTRQPLVFADISEINESFREDRHQHIKSWIGIPLIARDKVIGLISIDHRDIGAYTEEDVQLAQAFANQVAIALENARLYELEVREFEREMDFAQEIQETLLPQFIPQVPGLDIAGRNVPARQVGGDFFHFFSADSEQLGVAIGDVSGKGIPAALYMAAGITAIDTQTGPEIMPGELLNKLNKKLYNRLQENKMNIALQVATFIPLPQSNDSNERSEKKAGGSIMTVASAGMIAPIGATEHGCRFLPVSGLPIGALPAHQYEYVDEVFLLDPFTIIIFTSDGIVEAQNELGEMFGFDRLEATVLEIVSAHDADQIAEHIIDAAQNFMGKAEQHDDMTVVVVVKE